MTTRQTILKAIYPLLMKAGKLFGMKAGVLKNTGRIAPPQPFYHLHATANNGLPIDFETMKGKKILLVNTASDCGYTTQLSELKTLSDLYKDRLMVIAFPSNDFKEQEKRSDEEIATFCVGTFGIQFPIARKSRVIKSVNQNAVFNWLTDKDKNGWLQKEPEWNFSKYLVNEHGVLTYYFGPGVSPLDSNVQNAIKSV